MKLNFEERLNLFDEYLNEYNEYPAVKEEYKGFKIGHWMNTIRMIYNHGEKQENGDIIYKSNILTNNKIILLKEHNFYFSRFDMYLSLLKEFIEKNERYPVFNETYKGKNIGAWVNKTRVICNLGIKNEVGDIHYKTFKLTKSQIEKLDEMNFMQIKPKTTDAAWNENFNLLKEFIEEYNRFQNGSEKYKGKCIGAWCNNQKLNINKGKEVKKDVYRYRHNSPTTKSQAKILIDNDFEFFVRKSTFYDAQIETKEDLLLKKRYLLLQLESLLENQKNEIESKDDIDKINKLYFQKIFK